MKSIVLFMAYYGTLPNYFDLWLKAIENNSTIDFCIVSDLLKGRKLPKNVKVLDLSFENFKERIQNKFEFKISLENYGRISQFRPALAYVFEEEVQGYDHWGYIECDLIPGDIRKFITDDILENYDKIFKLGHFQIFKNNKKMNELFMFQTKSALSYQFAFGKDILFFEELLGMHNIANAAGCKTYQENVFADIKCYELMFSKSTYSYENNNLPQRSLFHYEKGKITEYSINTKKEIETKEVLYVHLQKRAMDVLAEDDNDYLIIPNKFVSAEKIDMNYFKKVMTETKSRENDYRQMMKEKLEKQKTDRYKKLPWWKLRLIRMRIRKNGGIDLNGK